MGDSEMLLPKELDANILSKKLESFFTKPFEERSALSKKVKEAWGKSYISEVNYSNFGERLIQLIQER